MVIKVLELHHHAIRVGPTPAEADAVRDFYVDVLGLTVDPGRRVRSGFPGHWLDVGDHTQPEDGLRGLGAKASGEGGCERSLRSRPADARVGRPGGIGEVGDDGAALE
jgi:catechol 2,3-dioxygenase-like lactoylglutathione lyase family enzyme